MSGRRDRDYLLDIQEAIRRILSYTAGFTYEQYIADPKTQDAVVRNREVIGEAAKKLSRSLRSSHVMNCPADSALIPPAPLLPARRRRG